jgi:hypothetical protein
VTFNIPKTLMVLLICMTFVGQTMASTIMSYHMMSMTGMNGQAQFQDMPMMDHSNHDMGSDASDNLYSSYESETSTEDCCTKTCHCFTGGCSSFAAFIKNVSNDPIIDLPAKILSYSHLALSQQPTSLYRPPILS